MNSLTAKNAREHWEKEFNTYYIQPVLGGLDAQLNKAMDHIANDDKQGMGMLMIIIVTLYNFFVEHGQLFYLSYERVKLSGKSMEPHLWSYQQRISLEHLGQTLQEKKMKEKYRILHDFLHVVCE